MRCFVPVAISLTPDTDVAEARNLSFLAPEILLAQHFGADTIADGPTTFANSEIDALFHRDGLDQLHRHLDVVTGDDHLHPLRQLDRSRHVGRAHIELRAVAVEERRVPPTLFFGEHIHLRLERLVRLGRTRLGQHLPTLDVRALYPTQQTAHVVARLTLVQSLLDNFLSLI